MASCIAWGGSMTKWIHLAVKAILLYVCFAAVSAEAANDVDVGEFVRKDKFDDI